MLEEELKNRIGKKYFGKFDYHNIIGRVDFCVSRKRTGKQQDLFLGENSDGLESLLWAEAKSGKKHDINHSLVQLILTIGKERTFENYITPPHFRCI